MPKRRTLTTEDQIKAYVQAVVAEAPPMTDEKREYATMMFNNT